MIYQASNIKLEVGFLEKLVELSGARESHPRATQLFHVDYFMSIISLTYKNVLLIITSHKNNVLSNVSISFEYCVLFGKIFYTFHAEIAEISARQEGGG